MQLFSHAVPADGIPEPELLAGLRRGEVEAFDALYRSRGVSVRAYFAASGWSPSDAEDAVQEVFLRAWKERAGFARSGNPIAYLFRIARNLSIDRARTRTRDHRRQEALVVAARKRTAAACEAPEHRLDTKERHARVLAAIDGLPEALRAVLVLSKVAGLPGEEIARVLDIPAGTVASRLWAAVRRVASIAEGDPAPPQLPRRTPA